MISKLPSVIISILNWNSPIETILCIQSIKQLNYPKYELILIDNNSKDDSILKFQNAFPDIKLIRTKENLGYAGGHKLVLEYAFEHEYELLWILNNDTIVKEDSLLKLVEAYQRNGEAIYGSMTLENDEETIRFGGGCELINGQLDRSYPYNRFHGRKLSECSQEIIERAVSDVNGSSLFIPLSLIQKYGFIDTSYFLYSEETAYCYKLRQGHHISSIIVPSSLIIHEGSVSFRKSSRLEFVKSYYRIRNSKRFSKEYLQKPILGKKKMRSLKKLIRFFMKHFFLSQSLKDFDYWQTYYTHLALLHALLGIKGKYLDPNDFLTD